MNYNIYIGYDPNEGNDLAWKVCKRSILQHTKYHDKINIIKLDKIELEEKGLYKRKDTGIHKGSNNFTYTKFFIPYLNDYNGYSLFCDSDFIWETDIYELINNFEIDNENNNNKFSIGCVKHKCYTNEKTLNKTKMDGKYQSWYPRKNWTSLIIFNCSHYKCKKLTLDTLNDANPSWLQRLYWINEIKKNENDEEEFDDILIKSISYKNNFLYGYYSDLNNINAIHLTEGGPWFLYWYQNKIPNEIEIGKKWITYLNNNEKTKLYHDFINKNILNSNEIKYLKKTFNIIE